MGWRAIEWAAEQPVKGAAAKLVLMLLAKHYNDQTGACFPGHKLVAREGGGMSVATVKEAIGMFESLGLLKVSPRVRRGGGKTSNQYDLDLAVHVSVERVDAYLAGRKPRKTVVPSSSARANFDSPLRAMPSVAGRPGAARHEPPPEPATGRLEKEVEKKVQYEERKGLGGSATCDLVALPQPPLLPAKMMAIEGAEDLRAALEWTSPLANLGLRSKPTPPDVSMFANIGPISTPAPDRDDRCWLIAETWPKDESGRLLDPPPGFGSEQLDPFYAAKRMLEAATPHYPSGIKLIRPDTLQSLKQRQADNTRQV